MGPVGAPALRTASPARRAARGQKRHRVSSGGSVRQRYPCTTSAPLALPLPPGPTAGARRASIRGRRRVKNGLNLLSASGRRLRARDRGKIPLTASPPRWSRTLDGGGGSALGARPGPSGAAVCGGGGGRIAGGGRYLCKVGPSSLQDGNGERGRDEEVVPSEDRFGTFLCSTVRIAEAPRRDLFRCPTFVVHS